MLRFRRWRHRRALRVLLGGLIAMCALALAFGMARYWIERRAEERRIAWEYRAMFNRSDSFGPRFARYDPPFDGASLCLAAIRAAPRAEPLLVQLTSDCAVLLQPTNCDTWYGYLPRELQPKDPDKLRWQVVQRPVWTTRPPLDASDGLDHEELCALHYYYVSQRVIDQFRRNSFCISDVAILGTGSTRRLGDGTFEVESGFAAMDGPSLRTHIAADGSLISIRSVGGMPGFPPVRDAADLALAEKARDAVLDLVRSDRGLFIGDPDPDKLKALPLQRGAAHTYAFGAFVLNVEKHWYSAEIGLEGPEPYLYNGLLRVRPDGRWEAGRPQLVREHRKPEAKP